MYLQSTTSDFTNLPATLALFGLDRDRDVQDQLTKAVRMEVWASRFTEIGSDYCELRFFDGDNVCTLKRRVDGY